MYKESPPETLRPGVVVPLDAPAEAVDRRPGLHDAGATDDAIPADLENQVFGIEQRLESLRERSADDLKEDLHSWAVAAVESADLALSSAHRAIIYAWATGCMFNLAKETLGRGVFGPWRITVAVEVGIKERTVQLWMKLARDCRDVRALLVPGASLMGAYRATGVLPTPNSAAEDGDDEAAPPPATPTPTDKAFSALAAGRQKLRHLLESGELLDDEERDRLEEEKSAFVTLIDKLLNPIIP